MLDLRRLRALQAFARTGTVAGAAAALSYTSSAVSQHLSKLQDEAGVPLLRREGRGLQLTDAGRLLVAHADDVFARLERTEAALAGLAGDVVGTVRVAAFQLAALEIVLPAMTRLRADHPDLRVEFSGFDGEQSLPLVRHGHLDVAVLEDYGHAPRPREPQLDRIDLPADDMMLVLPADHPAARSAGPVPLSSLADLAWATADDGTTYAAMFVRLCRSVGGFEPDVRYRDNDFRILLALAAQGHAATVLPALGRPQDEPRVAVRPLAGGPFPRQIFLAVRAADRDRPVVRATVGALVAAATAAPRAGA